MKLSTRARYAVRCMVAIARLNAYHKPISLEKVAKATRISFSYLEHLMMALKNASLVRSVVGRGGGYALARPAKDIRVGHIVEASIGPINVVNCVRMPEFCLIADTCECRMLYRLINHRIRQALYEYTLADLSSKQWGRQMSKWLAEQDQIPIESDGHGSPWPRGAQGARTLTQEH